MSVLNVNLIHLLAAVYVSRCDVMFDESKNTSNKDFQISSVRCVPIYLAITLKFPC